MATPASGAPPRPSLRRALALEGARLVLLLLSVAGCTRTPAQRPEVGAATAGGAPWSPFVLGADISALDAPWPGARPRSYQDHGSRSDELTILRSHGWNAFRVRVFVPPVRQAPPNTVEAAIPLAQHIVSSGAKFLLDLHLSDTWADPGHQDIPVAWRGLGFDALEKQVETYCRDTIKRFKDAGAMPDWVQVGNEITRGTLWPLAEVRVPGATGRSGSGPYDDDLQWDHLTRILKAGIRGVMAGAGDTPPRIALHIDKGANWEVTRWFFDHINEANVPYDIIAESFYPEWGHGTLDQLWNNMQRCAVRYHMDFLVVETGYGPSHVKDNQDMLWPETPEGRLQFMADIVNTVRKAPYGLGVMYWAPEREAWNADGSPGPVVSVLDHLKDLTARPASHAPAAVAP